MAHLLTESKQQNIMLVTDINTYLVILNMLNSPLFIKKETFSIEVFFAKLKSLLIFFSEVRYI